MSNAETNRSNAQHSTGPRTPEGKQRSSLNALRHGLTGQIIVMPTEDMQAYRSHVASFTGDLRPKGPIETNLVQSLADTAWRLNRVAALEANLLTLAAAREPDPCTDAPGQIQQAMAIAAALENHSKTFSHLSLHSQRLSRQFERTAAQLAELQKTRRDQEARDLKALLEILDMFEKKGQTHTPSEDGFVFTEAEITQARQARTREWRSNAAANYASA
jgi:hypothetical protein